MEANLEEENEKAESTEAEQAKPSPNDTNTLASKWSKETIDIGYAVLPSALLRGQARLKIGANELAVLVHLIDHWWRPGEMQDQYSPDRT